MEIKIRGMSMELLVLSDSHGRRDRIEESVSLQIKKPDAVIFLGDGLKDIVSADIGDIPTYCVCGNCDTLNFFLDCNAPTEQNLILGEKRIFFTHGHKYGVKSALSPLICEGVARGADIILFGHTHIPFEKTLLQENEHGINTDKEIHVFNPGSIGEYPYSFGVITIDRCGGVLLSHGKLK